MMSNATSGASTNGRRLFKSVPATALALSALAAGALLSGTRVKASTTTCTPLPMAVTPIINPGGQTCTTTDPNLHPPGIYSNTATVISAPGFPGFTQINLEGTGLNYPLAQQQIDTDFNTRGPLGGGNYTGGLISSIYKVTANTPDYPLDGIDLTASGIGDFTVKKEVFTSYIDGVLSNKIAELNLTGAGSRPVTSFSPVSTIYIRDTFNNPISGQSSIDNAQNTLRNVPGPLPILGAGAAFGFSRKLRGRIKAARLS